MAARGRIFCGGATDNALTRVYWDALRERCSRWCADRRCGSRTCAKSLSRRDPGRPISDQTIVNPRRSEEHTSELQSLMRISYAVFFLKQKKHLNHANKSH